MNTCTTCGNQYDKCFSITKDGQTLAFDCFECAIQTLAPDCNHCQCKIIGHGLEQQGKFFCCVHCAKSEGETTLKDRA